MRKLFLIAAMVLVSATAQAGQSRGLTLASNDEPAAATQPKATDRAADTATQTPQTTDSPKFIARPSAVDATTTPEQPKADAAKPVTRTKTDKPKRKRYWNEARIVGELHRHGIYW